MIKNQQEQVPVITADWEVEVDSIDLGLALAFAYLIDVSRNWCLFMKVISSDYGFK